jgi:mannose-1-phosphate guanylyltransferase
MEAILLAGGFGTRIRPLTYTRPKPLLPIANRTLIERALDLMPKSVKTVVLPVNYLGELIRQHFEDHPDPRLVIVDEPEPLGTGGAIKAVAEYLTGPFIVFNADIVSSIDLQKFADFHHKSKGQATISLYPVDEPWHFGVVVPGANGKIKSFVEKPPKGEEPSNLVNAGHYMVNLEVLDRIPPKKFVSMEREVFTPLAKEGKMHGFQFDGYWIDCGRPETYLEAHKATLSRLGKSAMIGDDVNRATGAKLLSYAVGDGCDLGAGSVVERSVLLPGVRVGKNVRIVDSVVGEGVEIEDGTTLDRCVVGDYATVAGGRTIKGQKIGLRPEDLEKLNA